MVYRLTRKELKTKKGSDYKDYDVIVVDNKYEIEIYYNGYDIPSLCSKVWDINRGKYQDEFFRPNYITEFLTGGLCDE